MRKVLSFVLVLSLVLGSFSMAFAAETTSAGLSDIDGIANEAAVQVAYDLGIVTGNPDGTFLPTKAVTRAEFAAMITRALAIPESALAGYTATSFKDTAGYSWAVPYLAFCQSKGIMLGDGAGNVMPGRTINTNEAVTMVLRAIGYTSNSAELVGVWPANYVTKAQDLGIYDDVAAVVSVDKANAAQIIYNALTIAKVQVATDGTTTALATTMLTAGLDCTQADRAVNYGEDAVININQYVGAYATIYFNSDDEIVAVKEKSTFLTGKFNAAHDTFTADDVDYDVTPGNATSYGGIVNTDASTPAATTLAAGYPDGVTYTIAADLSGKTIESVYSVHQWVATADEQVDDGIQDEIADNKILNVDFYENDDDAIDTDSFQLAGVASLDKIAEDNVVYVYADNTGKVVKVKVGTEVVEGTVTAFNNDDGAKINGKYYANSGIAANGLAAGNVSDVVKVWLDSSGDVYDFDVTEGNADNYAVVTKATAASGFDSIIKLIDKDGTEKSYTLDDDVAPAVGAPAVGTIVLFGLDSDGIIEALDTTSAGAKANDTCVAVAGGQLTVSTAKVLSIGAASYQISSDVVVFTYEGATTSTATGFDIATIADVDDTAITSTTAVYFNGDGVVTAILVPADNASNAADDLYGVINTKELTVNADNDKVYQLVGFANGAALDKLSSSESKGNLVNNPSTPNIYLYKFGVDADGAISEVTAQLAYYEAGGIVTNTALAITSDTGIVVASAGDGYITASTAAIGTLAIADTAKFYQVKYDGADVDEYSIFTGTVREGYKVWLYETDDDEAGYDIVVVLK